MPIYDADIMRAIVDLDERVDRALKQLARARGASRAQVVREALEQYLQGQRAPADVPVFGLWRGRKVDGVDYQRRLRKEWPST